MLIRKINNKEKKLNLLRSAFFIDLFCFFLTVRRVFFIQ